MKTIVCLLFVFFLSCSNSDDFENGITFYWEQTKCNDPWGTTENNFESTTKIAMKEYFKDNGIDKFNIIGFENTLTENSVTCDSCGCQNGMIILVEVVEVHRKKWKNWVSKENSPHGIAKAIFLL